MRIAMLVSAFARAISGQVTAGPFEDGMAALERLDFVQAAQWFRKAADQGHASAARTINRRMVVSLVTGLAVGIPPPVLADQLTTLATLTGRCTAITAMDVVTDPSLCLNKVVNVEFPNGRLGFAFTLQRKGDPKPTVISFFGDGPKQLHIDADTAMQPIDHVNFTFQGSTDKLVAAGSCRFSNPYNGKPARVSCTADTNQGKFAGEFISNGVAPNMSQSR